MAQSYQPETRYIRSGDRLVLATHNQGKASEIRTLLQPHGIEVVSAAELGLAEPVEDAPDFVGNARIKAVAAAHASGLVALADDSGFCVAALDGAPGIFSARWAGEAKDFNSAMALVHARMAEHQDRRAWFICVLCVAWPDGATSSFVGRVDGLAVWPPRGSFGFGYDAMFEPSGSRLTYGEMDPAMKHATSHRARAFAQFLTTCLR